MARLPCTSECATMGEASARSCWSPAGTVRRFRRVSRNRAAEKSAKSSAGASGRLAGLPGDFPCLPVAVRHRRFEVNEISDLLFGSRGGDFQILDPAAFAMLRRGNTLVVER